MRRRLVELLDADSVAVRPATAADGAFERLLHGETDPSAGFWPDDALTVSVTNPRTQHLYARLGFVSTDATDTDISMESRRVSGSTSHG